MDLNKFAAPNRAGRVIIPLLFIKTWISQHFQDHTGRGEGEGASYGAQGNLFITGW